MAGHSMAGGTDALPRPLSVRLLEIMHVVGIAVAIWLSPKGMIPIGLAMFGPVVIAVLAITRLRLSLVWLVLVATCIGFLLFVPMGAAFRYERLAESPWNAVRLGFVLVMAAMTLALLWSSSFIRWLKDGGGRVARFIL